ncbi:MAG: CRISPR system precrRNA processing endoribonuclease RAMP protein Cas6 [Chromatiaceae bacterium]|nr:CRISPR system precrRNA processing endoribonuclease RAMP protein Cas6 [Chromatiaceae bacterium]
MTQGMGLESVPPRSAPVAVQRLRFMLEAVDPLRLPPYAGSAWRGLLGYGLRRTACVTRQPVCDGCLLRHTCVYSTFFESPAQPQADGRYQTLPHPFVLEPDLEAGREVLAGDPTRLGVTLLGPYTAQAPYLIHALQLAGGRGLGREGRRFRVVALEREASVGAGDWERVYDTESGEYHARPVPPVVVPDWPGAPVRLTLVTPLRIKRHGHFVGAGDFAPADLLRHLCARVEHLARLYGGDGSGFDWTSLHGYVDKVHLRAADLRWHEWTRYSSRQDTLMQMGGLLGTVELDGDGLAAFWPVLWLGQWLHVGKGTSFGLGGYRVATMLGSSPA